MQTLDLIGLFALEVSGALMSIRHDLPGVSHFLAPPALGAGCAVMPGCGWRTCRYCSDGLSRVCWSDTSRLPPIGGEI